MSRRDAIDPPDLPDVFEPGDLATPARALDNVDVIERSLAEVLTPASDTALSQVRLQRVTAAAGAWPASKWTDVLIDGGDLSNTNLGMSRLRRVTIQNARLTGLDLSRASLSHVLFRDCRLDLSCWIEADFDRCRFEQCDLSAADFADADLSGVSFAHCNLREARFVGAKLKATDIRTSRISRLEANPADVRGLIIEPMQAIDLAPLLGVTIKPIDPEA